MPEKNKLEDICEYFAGISQRGNPVHATTGNMSQKKRETNRGGYQGCSWSRCTPSTDITEHQRTGTLKIQESWDHHNHDTILEPLKIKFGTT